jgi:hypothetical protein
MIPSTPSSDRTGRTETTPPIPAKAQSRPPLPVADQVSLDKLGVLRAALAAQPEVRPEVVERGRELAADKSWPPASVLRRVSEIILRAPDLSEDLS